MRICLDLSPIYVNRTAARTICEEVIETADSIAGLHYDFQFFGHRHAARLDRFTSGRYLQTFFGALAQGRFELLSEDLWADVNQGGTRTFYVDPLYVLFAPLRRCDIVLLLDLSPLTDPSWHNPAVSAAYVEALRKIRRIGPDLAAISISTAETFESNFGFSDKPITHLPLSVPRQLSNVAAAEVQALASPWPYFLFVGSLETRKNMIGAIRSFALSQLGQSGYKLLIIGGDGHGGDEINRAAASLDSVVIAGYLTTEELCAAYRGATGFVYPSYLEGFGVPLLEAMSFGVPCIASITGACPEVGGEDVTYVDPDDHLALAEGMRQIVALSADARSHLGERLMRRAATVYPHDSFKHKLTTMLTQ